MCERRCLGGCRIESSAPVRRSRRRRRNLFTSPSPVTRCRWSTVLASVSPSSVGLPHKQEDAMKDSYDHGVGDGATPPSWLTPEEETVWRLEGFDKLPP